MVQIFVVLLILVVFLPKLRYQDIELRRLFSPGIYIGDRHFISLNNASAHPPSDRKCQPSKPFSPPTKSQASPNLSTLGLRKGPRYPALHLALRNKTKNTGMAVQKAHHSRFILNLCVLFLCLN